MRRPPPSDLAEAADVLGAAGRIVRHRFLAYEHVNRRPAIAINPRVYQRKKEAAEAHARRLEDVAAWLRTQTGVVK